MPILNRQDVMEVFAGILREECGVTKEAFSEEMRLQEDLELESVGLLTFAGHLENHFEIFLGESPDRPPQTLADVVDLVLLRLQEKQQLPNDQILV